MIKAFDKLEMVVCVDQFFNETVQHADIVLPVTTTFEQWDVSSSYWHYWLSVNEPAIKPLYECKSDAEIAALLSKTINKLEPGSCTFPQAFDAKRWLDQEFNEGWGNSLALRAGMTCRKDHAKQNGQHRGPVRSQVQNAVRQVRVQIRTMCGKWSHGFAGI